jgi:hypothetical protein
VDITKAGIRRTNQLQYYSCCQLIAFFKLKPQTQTLDYLDYIGQTRLPLTAHRLANQLIFPLASAASRKATRNTLGSSSAKASFKYAIAALGFLK